MKNKFITFSLSSLLCSALGINAICANAVNYQNSVIPGTNQFEYINEENE